MFQSKNGYLISKIMSRLLQVWFRCNIMEMIGETVCQGYLKCDYLINSSKHFVSMYRY